MTLILYVSLFIIWLLGYVNAVQTFDNDTDTAITSRLAVNVACALWPVALCIAILSIVIKAVFGKRGNKSSKGGKK